MFACGGRDVIYPAIPGACQWNRLRAFFLFPVRTRTNAGEIGAAGLLCGWPHWPFQPAKNHTRLFRIFKTVLQQKPQARLLLCGQGENFEQSQQEAKALGIAEMVLFCGNVNRPEDYLQAMDVFVMTSLFEGLPIVGVEAQASGLPCIFADTITQEVKILPQTQFLALTQPDEAWAERIVQTKPMERSLAGHCVESAGFAEENLDRQVCALYGMEEHHFANISGRNHL